jgi:hypothetical protein
MALYESEITQFLRSLKQERPHLDSAQQQGRLLLWDQDPIVLDETGRTLQVRVRQKPYVYQTD